MEQAVDEALMFRHPTMDDAQLVFELLVRCDISEYGEPDTDLEDIIHDWGQIDLTEDAWIALTPTGKYVGYAAVLPWGQDLRFDFHVDAKWKGITLGQDLLTRCEARAQTLATKKALADEMVGRTYIAHVNEQDRDLVVKASFQPGRYIFQMEARLDKPLPEVRWPDGVDVRTAVPGQDDYQLYELIQDAFEQPGRVRPTFESWKTSMLRADIFEPDLWFVAEADQQMVGACLCFAYPSTGWVRQLGVREAWRRKGIGAALLSHAFGRFRARDFLKVGLTVESKRPDAFRFYQTVGMRQVRQYDEYYKPIGSKRSADH